MITEGICSYKVAKLLRQLGFDEPCERSYDHLIQHDGKSISFDEEMDLIDAGRAKEIKRIKGGFLATRWNRNSSEETGTSCPTHAHANRWLRDTHGYHVAPSPVPFGKWKVWCVILGKPNLLDGLLNATDLNGKTFKTHDDAMEAGLLFVLKSLVNARKTISKMELSPQEREKMRKELREEGFDV